ncbi:hypothetical protein [Magnetovibrio sp.]|uniref:hypothetical protein n=1 Tax=Magnetovibrio sp. TaxID=2024836 RepID=UPI002F92A744
MNLQPVNSESALQRRLKRFWCDNRKRKRGLLSFVESLHDVGAPAVFGGMVRDFARGGAVHFRSDVDMVVSTDDADHLDWFLRNYDSVRNKFGGHRVRLDRWLVDVWPVANTWAFNQGYVDGGELKDLTQTTFFNWDAAVYEISTNHLHLIDRYIEDVEEGHLDINLEANPNPSGMVVRAWKLMRSMEASISPELAVYICNFIYEHKNELIHSYASKASYYWITPETLDQFYGLLDEHLTAFPSCSFKLPPRQSSIFELLEN